MLPRPGGIVRRSILGSIRYSASAAQIVSDQSIHHQLHALEGFEAQSFSEEGSNSLFPATAEQDEPERRERRSPAAVLGSKRLGSVAIPQTLEHAIQSRIRGAVPQSILRLLG